VGIIQDKYKLSATTEVTKTKSMLGTEKKIREEIQVLLL
jgi:hypothetical protein